MWFPPTVMVILFLGICWMLFNQLSDKSAGTVIAEKAGDAKDTVAEKAADAQAAVTSDDA